MHASILILRAAAAMRVLARWRTVCSGDFTYRVDLMDPAGNYTQQNLDVPPNKIRRIRRVVH